MKNWENKEIDIRTNAITHTMKRRDTLRMAMTKVLRQNEIDVFVNPVNPTLQGKIGGAAERGGGGGGRRLRLRRHAGHSRGLRARGFADSIYDCQFMLSEDGKSYDGEESNDAHEARRHRPAVQHRLLGRAGPGGDPAQGRLRVRGRDASSQAAAGVRPGEGRGRAAPVDYRALTEPKRAAAAADSLLDRPKDQWASLIPCSRLGVVHTWR